MSCLLLYFVPAHAGTPLSVGYLGSCLAGLGLHAPLLERPPASLLAASLAAAVAWQPGSLQLHRLLRHVAGRRHLLGPRAKYSSSAPGKSSSAAARWWWLCSVPACSPWKPSALAPRLLARLLFESESKAVKTSETGGVMLVSNHVSWAAGAPPGIGLPAARVPRLGQCFEGWSIRWFARAAGVSIQAGSGAILRSIRTTRAVCEQGDLVVSFPRAA